MQQARVNEQPRWLRRRLEPGSHAGERLLCPITSEFIREELRTPRAGELSDGMVVERGRKRLLAMHNQVPILKQIGVHFVSRGVELYDCYFACGCKLQAWLAELRRA